MTALIVDLESIPTAAALAAPYPAAERPHPKNYVKEEAIAAWRERDEAEWRTERVKQCSLSPRLGRIVCIGFYQEGVMGCAMAHGEDEEAAVLRDFWDMATAADRLVTFNGHGFDVPFLIIRSLINGVRPSVNVAPWLKRYQFSIHFDCRMALTNWNSYGDGTLGDWCTALGLPFTMDLTGDDIWTLYQEGKFDAIAAKCRADVDATAKLYERLAPIYG